MGLAIGTPWSVVLSQGQPQQTMLRSPGGKLVFGPQGPGTAVVGMYTGSQPLGSNGVLRIEASAKRAVRMLPPGEYLVVAAPMNSGQFTLSVRPWSFWDYFRSSY